MLQTLFKSMRESAVNDEIITRRHQVRRELDRCIAIIDDQTHPVENWSLGGLLVTANDRLYSVGQEIDVTMKFKLEGKILDVTHKGRVVRKTNGKISLQFLPLTDAVRGLFMQVIDDDVANEFANSQAVG